MSRATALIHSAADVQRVQSAFKAQCRQWLQLRAEWLQLSDALCAAANDVVNEGIQALYVDPHANEYVGANRAVHKELCVAHEQRRENHLRKCRSIFNQLVRREHRRAQACTGLLTSTRIAQSVLTGRMRDAVGAAHKPLGFESVVKMSCGGTTAYYCEAAPRPPSSPPR